MDGEGETHRVPLSESLEILRKAGFDVPVPLEAYAKDREREARGVLQVWACKCGFMYETPIKLLDYEHSCGKTSRKVWSAPST